MTINYFKLYKLFVRVLQIFNFQHSKLKATQ